MRSPIAKKTQKEKPAGITSDGLIRSRRLLLTPRLETAFHVAVGNRIVLGAEVVKGDVFLGYAQLVEHVLYGLEHQRRTTEVVLDLFGLGVIF